MSKPKLIYIAGSGRSGSTLLACLLSESEGCVGVGEPIWLWSLAIKIDSCTCGEKYSDCSLWGRILDEYFHVSSPGDISVPLQGRFIWAYQTLLILLGFKGIISQEYLDILRKLYTAVYELTGAKVIIDESKFLPYLYALTRTELFDLYVIHLVRDPRAVAFSWRRTKKQRTGYMPRYPYWVTARFWLIQQALNSVSHCFVSKDKYKLIRYEDFVENPDALLREIFTWAGLERRLPFVKDHRVHVTRQSHLVIGNPSVPKQGINTIRMDVEWQQKMPAWAKILVTLICWPMMLVHGYSIIPNHVQQTGKLK